VNIRHGLLAAMVSLVCAGAQETQTADLKGKVQGPERIMHGYVIELEQLGSHRNSMNADVQADGEFSFRGVPVGEYMLRVTSFQGAAISQQLISIRPGMGPCEVRLPPQSPSPTGAKVSVGELRHPPARKAVDATVSALHFAETGQYDRAAGELEKATRISPDFAAAHSNLGVQYLRMHRFDDARNEIERALEIAGPNARDFVNLSFALIGLHRIPEAMDAAKAALRLERENAPAHYILGSLQAMDRETRGEGVAHLEVAAKTLEAARKALAKLAGPAD
jgi:tetratricopeptide (TPR) repeat protein